MTFYRFDEKTRQEEDFLSLLDHLSTKLDSQPSMPLIMKSSKDDQLVILFDIGCWRAVAGTRAVGHHPLDRLPGEDQGLPGSQRPREGLRAVPHLFP